MELVLTEIMLSALHVLDTLQEHVQMSFYSTAAFTSISDLKLIG